MFLHALHQQVAIGLVARVAGGDTPLCLELIEGSGQRGHDLHRRGETPLPRGFEAAPLLPYIQADADAVAFTACQMSGFGDNVAKPRHALQPLVGGPDQGDKRCDGAIDRHGAERAHCVHDQPASGGLNDGSNRPQWVQQPAGGLAMHQRHVGEGRVLRQRSGDGGRVDYLVLRRLQHTAQPAQPARHSSDAAAVRAVDQHQQFAVAWHQRADCRLHREGAAALDRHRDMGVRHPGEGGQAGANTLRQGDEGAVPRAPIAVQCRSGHVGRGQGTGGEQQPRVGITHIAPVPQKTRHHQDQPQ